MDFTKHGLYGNEDAFDNVFSAEIKDRAAYAGRTFFNQAENNAKGKIPLLVVHVTGQRRTTDLVHMRMDDWLKLYSAALKGKYNG